VALSVLVIRGAVVTAARLVFAFTHGVVHLQRPARARPDRNDNRPGPAVRHTDRAVVHDAVIAALLGRWFWWPVRVRQPPVPQKFGEDTRQLSLF
jgi:RND superfamily putative drug exporter